MRLTSTWTTCIHRNPHLWSCVRLCSRCLPAWIHRCAEQVYTAFDRHLDALGVYKLDTIGDAFVVVAGLEGFGSQEASELATTTTP